MAEVQLKKPEFIKVKDIETGRNGYNVLVRVISTELKEVETRDGRKIPMIQAVVADETGSSGAFFKGDDAKIIAKDKVIAIRNGVKRIVKGHISL